MGVEVIHGPDHPSLSAWLRENGAALDHVLLSRPDVAEDCLPVLRAHTKARISYYGHDLHFRRMHQQGEHLRDEAILRLEAAGAHLEPLGADGFWSRV